jgi:ethanolamine permease
VFWISALAYADFHRWALNIDFSSGKLQELLPGSGEFLPNGFGGAFAAMAFAVWLFLGIEELPLAAEESHDPARDMPKALIFGMATLVVSALLTMLLNASIGDIESKFHGAFSLATSAEPLLDGFRVIYGEDLARTLALCAVIGLIASFHTIMFAYGRQIYSLSRAGYYPGFMSLTHGVHKTPHAALLVGAAIGLAILLVIWFALGEQRTSALAAGTLVFMAVFGAMISYASQAASFILLRRNMPDIPRPYRSPLGIPGAAVTIFIAAWTMYYQFTLPDYRSGVYAALAWYVAGLLYFAVLGRHRLILSPEESFALRRGRAAEQSSSS